MYPDYKVDEQILDKKSEGSCKLSKSRKIKKPQDRLDRFQKEKDKTQKITNFFKKLQNQQIQRPKTSSQKNEQKRSPEQEQIIEQLQNQERQLQHEEELLKKQIQTVKSEYQIKLDQWNLYLKKLRNCQVADIKERYNFIRFQKQFPEYRKMQLFAQSSPQEEFLKHNKISDSKVTLQIKEILQKIKQKKQLLLTKGMSNFQKNNLEKNIRTLEEELRFLTYQNQQYQEKFSLSLKEKTSKFAQLNWPLIGKRYQTLELIGFGGYSEVYKALNLTNNQHVAIKLCSVTQMSQMNPDVYLKHLLRECETHKSLNHANIVKFYEVIEIDKLTFCLVLQLCQGPQLSKYIKRKGRLRQQQTKAIMFQVFETLYYLSTFSPKKIVHYDLKPQNIMFHQGLIKILDFGLNKQIDEEQSRAALTSAALGTHAYLPPEIHHNDTSSDRVLSNKVDIWSSGIIFYELLNGKRPTRIQDIQMYQNSIVNLNNETIQIIKMCLKLNPAERITPEEVYFHPYFDEFERKYKRK